MRINIGLRPRLSQELSSSIEATSPHSRSNLRLTAPDQPDADRNCGQAAEQLSWIRFRPRPSLGDRSTHVETLHLIADRADARRIDSHSVQNGVEAAGRTLRNGHTRLAMIGVKLTGGIHVVDHPQPPEARLFVLRGGCHERPAT